MEQRPTSKGLGAREHLRDTTFRVSVEKMPDRFAVGVFSIIGLACIPPGSASTRVRCLESLHVSQDLGGAGIPSSNTLQLPLPVHVLHANCVASDADASYGISAVVCGII